MMRIAAILLGTFSLTASGCAMANEVDQTRNRSAVGVIARGCSLVDTFGTGVAIQVGPQISASGESYIATSAHTVAGANKIVVRLTDQVEHPASLVAFDPDSDVAILRVDDLAINALAIGTVHRDAQAMLVTWNPDLGYDSRRVKVNRPLTVTIEDIYVEETVTRQGLEINTAVIHGDSGGPVIDDAGELLGIIYATSREQQLAYAVAGSEIARLALDISEHSVSAGRCS